MSKYGAIVTYIDGIRFASKAEADRYQQLKILLDNGYIQNLKLHPSYLITIATHKICHVILDFAYVENNKWIYEDVKGCDTAISRLKRKLVEAQHGIKVTLIKKPKKSKIRKLPAGFADGAGYGCTAKPRGKK